MKRLYAIFYLLIFTFSCSLPGSKITEVNELDKNQKIPINITLKEGQYVYKKKICITGFSDSPILINYRYELENKIDTCFVSEWYFTSDSLIIESENAKALGKLSITHEFYY
uniref:hypothetical protein n=1 Tax=Roseivirga sp. TaxID=1964215 RepID=UPI004047FA18